MSLPRHDPSGEAWELDGQDVTCTDPNMKVFNNVPATGRAQRLEAEKFQNIWTGILWRMLAAAVLSAQPPDGVSH
jgi:hypothetical protein